MYIKYYLDKYNFNNLEKYKIHLYYKIYDDNKIFIKEINEKKENNEKIDSDIILCNENELCNENIQSEEEIKLWLEQNQTKYDVITNSEEMAKSRIGEILYEKLIKDYTYKQWNKYPKELDKSVLERIPVKNNYDTRYFTDKYQVLPDKGYTNFIKQLLNNKLITIILNTDYNEYKKNNDLSIFKKIIYTGSIDKYFDNINEKLEYRSINFIKEIYENMNYYQPNSVINYPNMNVPYTRIVEYKHFLNQKSKHTIIFKEITTDIGEPYYPVPTERNKLLYDKFIFFN